MRVLRDHRLPAGSLQDVFRATVIAKLTYGALAWSGLCSANDRARLDAFLRLSSDIVAVRKTLQQSVTCFLLLMTLCSSVSSTMIYTYCNRYYLLKPVLVTIYVLVTTTDNCFKRIYIHTYSVSQKSSPPPLKLFAIFSLMVNLCK